MDERQLIEKLRLVEALFEGAGTAGERDAAASALERLQRQLNEVLCAYLEETTERVIRQGIHEDSSEAEVMKALPGA